MGARRGAGSSQEVEEGEAEKQPQDGQLGRETGPPHQKALAGFLQTDSSQTGMCSAEAGSWPEGPR